MARVFITIVIIFLLTLPVYSSSAEVTLRIDVKARTLSEIQGVNPVIISKDAGQFIYQEDFLQFSVKSNVPWSVNIGLETEYDVGGNFYVRFRELGDHWILVPPSGREFHLTDRIGVFTYSVDLKYVRITGVEEETCVLPKVEIIGS
jgi:hypothetical protein